MVRDAYVAIADPTRRDILVLLRERGELSAGEIAGRFPSVTRPAVSRHLRVLRECGVVRTRRQGKQQQYQLEPRPLEAIRNGWLAGFAQRQSASLRALRRRVEPR